MLSMVCGTWEYKCPSNHKPCIASDELLEHSKTKFLVSTIHRNRVLPAPPPLGQNTEITSLERGRLYFGLQL